MIPWVAPRVLGQLQACPLYSLCGLWLDRLPENKDGDPQAPPRPGLQTQAEAAWLRTLSRASPTPVGSLTTMPSGLQSDILWPCCFLKDTDKRGARVTNTEVLEAGALSGDQGLDATCEAL